MSYIDNNLLKDEQIIFRTRKHLLIFFYPLLWTLCAFYATPYMESNAILSKLAFAPWLVAGIFWFAVWVQYMSSEFAVTNKRIMMREGFFTRHTNETRLSAISQVNVDQSLLAQLLNYGRVTVNAFGAFDAFTLIAHPYKFQHAVNEQIDKSLR